MSDDKFFAWLDGELDGAEAEAMAARVAADPSLASLADQHRALGNRLRGAFAPVATAPIPESLSKAAKASAAVVDFASARSARSARSALAPVPRPGWMALAACLALGIAIGTTIDTTGSSGAPVESHGGKLYAAAGLDRALDRQLASAPGSDPVRVGITFRDQSGTICRSFTDSASNGLACRDRDQWQLRGLFVAPEGQQSDYRMASGVDPNLAALIDSTIAGEPFDSAQERQARDRRWR